MSLPYASPRSPSQAANSPKATRRTSTGGDGAPSVLLVDDHVANLVAMEALLDPLALALVSVTSGEAALMEVLRQDFALILMDIHMPGLDGFATTTLILSRPRSQNVPVVFVTAVGAADVPRLPGYLPGFTYLSKPVDPVVMRSKVVSIVSLWPLRQQDPPP